MTLNSQLGAVHRIGKIRSEGAPAKEPIRYFRSLMSSQLDIVLRPHILLVRSASEARAQTVLVQDLRPLSGPRAHTCIAACLMVSHVCPSLLGIEVYDRQVQGLREGKVGVGHVT